MSSAEPLWKIRPPKFSGDANSEITVIGLNEPTMIGAQLLGLPALGLDALLERYLGLPPTKSRQKDDWAERPLSPEQEEYAARDVRHLLALRRKYGRRFVSAA